MEEKPKRQENKTPRKKDATFKLSSAVKGLRFGGQFITKSFTVRRATTPELLKLLNYPSPSSSFPSTIAYLPTTFTILAHEAYHTLTLGLGTRRSKALLFIFDSESLCSAVERSWTPVIPLGDVNRRFLRELAGCEMARFKFRKGCLTFYLYAVRRRGSPGFDRADDLRALVESVAALNDFLDYTAMLAMPSQRSLGDSPQLVAAVN
ncbi:uncharacterized protein LOC110108917 [Dendrobium catenatum]|uniref:DUF7851 domain-containing protein n=1 Tax=Dendrobium catenatum TaxID=906689 RepID=A0A2I0VXR5_9ASPA|nr:uncharacterized protein LOC110108917 [Dendrobium catenatum]PKU68194.1 hypothetical protein MA16_Dca012863 [Dendrobium catenatum]